MKNDNSDWKCNLSIGMAIALIFTSMGGCALLMSKADVEEAKANQIREGKPTK
jgi:hypothetical protein